MAKSSHPEPQNERGRPRAGRPKRAKRKPRPKISGDPFLKNSPLIAAPELDLRTLVLLSMGDWSELADLEWPPEDIGRWLEKADVRQVRGLLLTTLHRWHELRRDG